MANNVIDARGLSCPEPVILTKNEADKGTKSITVLVDIEVAKENVSRFLENAGYKVAVKENGEDFELKATK